MKVLSLTGIFFIILGFGLFAAKYRYLKIEQKGDIVQMRIEKIPSGCMGTKAKHYATFNYQGERYIKRIGAHFCNEHNVGDLVEMKVLEGASAILFPYESIKNELLLLAGLGLLGVVLLIKVNFSK